MIISIHQPNFIPWIPYFKKIEQSDIFVILGHCQYEKNNFQNRFYFENQWQTLSVLGGVDLIKNKIYNNPIRDWKKMKKRLNNVSSKLELFDDLISNSLYDTNVGIIKKICFLLDIKTEIVLDYPTDKSGTERLVDICERYKCDTYLSGPSGEKYLNIEKFHEKLINVEYFDSTEICKESVLTLL